MRRSLLCCALLALAVGACSSSATPAPYQHPYYPAPTAAASYAPIPAAPTYAPAATMKTGMQIPGATPYAWATQNPYPQPTVQPRQTPFDPVIFPSNGINPYIDTRSDNVSTFGLDVDTASYTVARNYVAQGIRPDAASVRPEEWVNYFDQGYAAPETGAFAIHTDGGPTPFLSPGEVLLRIGVKARDARDGARPSTALTFVIDVSGSMADGGRLDLLKQSIAILVGQLRSDDSVAIVAFTNDARVVLQPTRANDKDRILGALVSLHPEDATNTEAGLRLGYEMARGQFIQGGINRVVLATDGVANVGNTDAGTMLGEVGANTAASGIQLITIGVGMGNYNDALLEQLANKGQGFYAYVDTLEEARRIFVDKLTTTIDTVALDAKAQIDFNTSAVAGYRLIGYEDRGLPDNSFRDPNATGGAIGAGHQVTALYALVLRPGESANERLATVSLRWTDPASMRAQEIAQDLYRGDLAASFQSTDRHFKMDALVAATAEVLRNSPWIPGYGVRDLQGAATALQGQLPETAEVRDFWIMLTQMSNLGR
jgi:Ca-activated chloride channel homolog